LLGEVVVWLCHNIIKPVRYAISRAIQFAWQNIIKPVLEAFRTIIRAVGRVVSWFYDSVIKPVWDAVGGAIRWAWENVIRPAFNRSEEHTSELQSRENLVCRLLLE